MFPHAGPGSWCSELRCPSVQVRERSRSRCSLPDLAPRKGCRRRAGHVFLPSEGDTPDDGRRCPHVNPERTWALVQQKSRARAGGTPGTAFCRRAPAHALRINCSRPYSSTCRSTAHSCLSPPSPQRLAASRNRTLRLCTECAPVAFSLKPPSIHPQQRRAPRLGRKSPPAVWPVPVVRPTGAQRIKTHGTKQDAYRCHPPRRDAGGGSS